VVLEDYDGEVTRTESGAAMKTIDRRNAIKRAGVLAMGAAMGGLTAEAQESGITPETVYELRTYHLNPGKLPLILERFRTKERAIFVRCGMHPVAYWTVLDGPALEPGGGGTLIYIVRHKSRAAADASWAQFRTDPEWVALKAESEKDGAFVVKQEHTFMKLTDFSVAL
jgi:hypothetical protein